MCTYNDARNKVVAARKAPPAPLKFYKAVRLSPRGAPRSLRGHPWKKGWHTAVGDLMETLDSIDRADFDKTGIFPAGARVEGGAFHLAATFEDAKAWCEREAVDGVIELLVYPMDIIAWGTPNSSHGHQDVAVTRCYVESPKAIWLTDDFKRGHNQAAWWPAPMVRAKKSVVTKKKRK